MGVEIARVVRHLGGIFMSHMVGKRRFRHGQLIYSHRECKKGSRFWRKGNEYSLGFWSEVAIKYSSGDICFCSVAWMKEMNGCYCRQVCGFVGRNLFFQRTKKRSFIAQRRGKVPRPEI